MTKQRVETKQIGYGRETYASREDAERALALAVSKRKSSGMLEFVFPSGFNRDHALLQVYKLCVDGDFLDIAERALDNIQEEKWSQGEVEKVVSGDSMAFNGYYYHLAIEFIRAKDIDGCVRVISKIKSPAIRTNARHYCRSELRHDHTRIDEFERKTAGLFQ